MQNLEKYWRMTQKAKIRISHQAGTVPPGRFFNSIIQISQACVFY